MNLRTTIAAAIGSLTLAALAAPATGASLVQWQSFELAAGIVTVGPDVRVRQQAPFVSGFSAASGSPNSNGIASFNLFGDGSVALHTSTFSDGFTYVSAEAVLIARVVALNTGPSDLNLFLDVDFDVPSRGLDGRLTIHSNGAGDLINGPLPDLGSHRLSTYMGSLSPGAGFADFVTLRILSASNRFSDARLSNIRLAYRGVDAAPPPPGVPEPATWAMMIAGFGLAGSALRRRGIRRHRAIEVGPSRP